MSPSNREDHMQLHHQRFSHGSLAQNRTAAWRPARSRTEFQSVIHNVLINLSTATGRREQSRVQADFDGLRFGATMYRLLVNSTLPVIGWPSL